MKINDAIPILVDKLQRQKLILFVGAGLSRASGLPDWKELFAPFCKKLGCPGEENYPAVATTIIEEKIYPRKDIIENIVEKIGDVDFELNENHYLIKRLPFKIIITTNYDNLLEELYGPTKVKRIYSDDGMAYFDPQAAKIQLIYLHGDINHPAHMLVSSIDYQVFADTRPIMVQKLKSLLQEYTFLFIGYSANDPNLHAIFDYFRLTYKEDAQRHFIALAGASKVKQVELRSRFGIEPIILKHYSQLTIFLTKLVEVYENPNKMEEYSAEEEPGKAVSPETLVETIKARGEKFFERAKFQIPVDFKPKAPFNVPGEDPHFTGREVEIDLVKKALLEKQTVGVTGLLGMGGIGKTSLAKHVTHMLHREGYFKDGICWHRLEAKAFPDSLDEIADAFGAHWLKEIPEIAVRIRYFQSIIQNLDVLFILDNAEYIENISPLMELFRNHPVLITSRRQLSGLTDVIDIDRLDEDKSLELFIKTWKQEDDEKKIKKIIDSIPDPESSTIRSVCMELLGGLPLAITIAASVLRFKKIDIPHFCKLLEEKKFKLLKDPNNVYKTEQKDKDVRLSFDLSFEQLPTGGLEQSLFTVMGIFGGEDFSKEALYEILKEEKKDKIESAVETLTALSMVQTRENQRLYLHPLLRQYALEKLPDFKGDVAYEKMADFYKNLVKSDPRALDYEWKNALRAAEWFLDHSKENDGLYLLLKIDRFLYETGKWNIREEWLKKGIAISDRIEDVSNYYHFTDRLQDLYIRQGKYNKCLEIINKLLDYCIKFKTLINRKPWLNYILAYSYSCLHEEEESYRINLKNIQYSLYFRKKEKTGGVYLNLGILFIRRGLYKQALDFYKANLAIEQKSNYKYKGNEIRAMGYIGDVYLDLGKYEDALEWYKRCESESTEYPHKELESEVFKFYFFYYLDTGDIEKAEGYLKKYEDTIKEFGEISSRADLNYCVGLIEKAKGNYQEAINTFQKAVQFYRDIQQEDLTGNCYFNMGICFLKTDNIRKARENFNEADSIFKKYKIKPINQCYLEAYTAFLEARFAYDQRAIRLFNRAKNTLQQIGVEDSKEIKKIEEDIRKEINEEKYKELLEELGSSENANETIDFDPDYLQVDPDEKEIISPIDGREMALIPSGFIESEHYDYPLYLYPFYMDKYPVSNTDYKKFIDEMDMEPPPHWENGEIPVGMEDHPVVGVTYDDALAYARWAGKDLPLKEEWEVAAGIGFGLKYPWGNEMLESHSYFIPPVIVNEEKENELIEEKKTELKETDKRYGTLISPLVPDDRIKNSDFVTGGDDHSFLRKMKIPPHHLKFDEKNFLELLSESISLTRVEKIRIVKSIPKLSQFQVDELIRIFLNEKKKFKELSRKADDHFDTVGKLRNPLESNDRIKDSDFVTGGDDHSFLRKMKIPPHHLKFDEEIFLELLSESISLTRVEKISIVNSIPKLSQFQVDELIRILVEKKKKFKELSGKIQKQVESKELSLSEVSLIIEKFYRKNQQLYIDNQGKIRTYAVYHFKNNCSRYGIFDLLGNVFEYTQSFMKPGVINSPLILKGFSYLRNSLEEKNDILDIHFSLIHHQWTDVGFRCVKRIYRKEDATKFIQTGNREKDWEIRWLYERAGYLFEVLSGQLIYEDDESIIQKGIDLCQKLLQHSPQHKKAAYMLIRFQFHQDEQIDFGDVCDHTIYPLIEKEWEKFNFGWNNLREVFADVNDAKETDGIIEKYEELKAVIEKIDLLLNTIESNLMFEDYRLTQRNTLDSLDYLLNRYEENLSFFYYVIILFICLMKIKLNALSKSLEAMAQVSAELMTKRIEKGKDCIAAVKISNQGLSVVKDVFIELTETKPPEAPTVKNFTLSQEKFNIPQLGSGETYILETNINAKKKGTFPLYISLYYTNPEAETGKDSEEIIEEQIQVVTLTTEISKEAVTFINPYLTGRPVQSPEMFFGRRDILEWIKNRLCANNIIILYGQRRTGKTSTLFQLKNVVYKDTAVPVFLTLLTMRGSDKNLFFFRMANELYKSLKDKKNLSPPEKEDFSTDPQYQLELFLEEAIDKAKEKSIIYLIDEFEGVFEMIKERRMDPSVLDNLRSIMQHFQQVWFLLAGTHALKHAAADYQSALFNIATFEKIGPLDEKDARDLVTKPLAKHIEYEPYAVDKIISLTNCHPYFIQMICFELVIYLETNQLRRVTVKEINFVVDEILQKGSSHFEYYWDYFTEAEQRFLSLLAENIKDYESFISMDRVRDFCKEKFKPGVDIYKLISGLIEKDFILEKKYRDKRHIGFFMDFFKRWTLIHHPSDDYQ